MDQKFTSVGVALSAGLMFFAGIIMIPLGVGFLLSYPDQIWWLGFLFLGASTAMILNGINNIKLSKRLSKEAEQDIKIISGQAQYPLVLSQPGKVADNITAQKATSISNQTTEINDTIVLAQWKYTEEEWKKFCKWEVKERKFNTTIEASIIIVFCLLAFSQDNWMTIMIVGFGVALIYWVGKYFLSMASLGQPAGKQSEVIITQYAVIINGKHNAFNSSMYWKGDVNIKEEPTPKVLEIIYKWSTRKGTSHDEIRVPIPEGKLEEAKWLKTVL